VGSRAGVYAVREGPYLAQNLEAALAGRPLQTYAPQRDFLSMLNLGDGTAIVGKWGLAFRGAWVWRWKTRIDETFMEKFQVLGDDGDPDTPFGRWFPPMDSDEPCGGCAAKVAPAALARVVGALPQRTDPAVLRGVREAADVAELQVGGQTVLATVDAFPAFTDDPWLVARLAARNALSDVLVQGGVPRFALAVVTVPEHGSEDVLADVMRGAGEVMDEVGCTIVGGHSTTGDTLNVGFTVLGAPSAAPMCTGGVQPGDAVVVLGALGTGVLWRADMRGLADGRWMQALVTATDRSVTPWIDLLRDVSARAATDVTGFGLAGHLAELAQGAGVGIVAEVGSAPALPGARALLRRGLRSTAHPHNRARSDVGVPLSLDDADVALWFDPTNAAAWAAVVPPEAVGRVEAAGGTVVGRVVAYEGGPRVALEET
jgi:selenide,water dikinase